MFNERFLLVLLQPVLVFTFFGKGKSTMAFYGPILRANPTEKSEKTTKSPQNTLNTNIYSNWVNNSERLPLDLSWSHENSSMEYSMKHDISSKVTDIPSDIPKFCQNPVLSNKVTVVQSCLLLSTNGIVGLDWSQQIHRTFHTWSGGLAVVDLF